MEDTKPVVYNVFLDDENPNPLPFDLRVAKETFRAIGEAWAARVDPETPMPPVFEVRCASDVQNILSLGTDGIAMIGEMARGYAHRAPDQGRTPKEGEIKVKRVEMPEIK